MKILTKVCFIALASLLMVVSLPACNGEAEPPPETPTGNQSPVINSLAAEEPTLTPNVETRVNCDASDPDGDELTYTWSATAGDITGTYTDFVIWQAPGVVGEFSVTVIVDDGQGGTTATSCIITVVTNQRPTVSSLTADPETLQPEETATITCDASDPDGDTITYSWSATGGNISGTGNIITWEAPDVVGEFVISVSLDDGKEEGITESSYRMEVAIPSITAVLEPIEGESGTVYYDGTLISQYRVGDTTANVGMRPYFMFDITGLDGAEIIESYITFNVKEIVGTPWFSPPFLYVDYLEYYEPRPLQAADFHLTGHSMASFNFEVPGDTDVYLRLTQALRPPVRPRLQVRLRLGADNNLNDHNDYIEFSNAQLVVTYIK